MIEGGKYVLAGETGVTPGKKIVRITATRSTGKKIEAGPPEPEGTMVDEIVSFIPEILQPEEHAHCGGCHGGSYAQLRAEVAVKRHAGGPVARWQLLTAGPIRRRPARSGLDQLRLPLSGAGPDGTIDSGRQRVGIGVGHSFS